MNFLNMLIFKMLEDFISLFWMIPPTPFTMKLHGDLLKVLKTPDIRERLVAAGSDPVGSTPEEFAAYVKLELARWGKVIRDNNIRAD